MRLRDLSDYVRFRGLVEAPGELVRFRSRRSDDDELTVRLHRSRPLGGHAVTLRRRSDLNIFREIWLNDEYRLDRLPPRAGSQRPLGCVLDFGGNVGLFAVRAAEIADRVICYEPMPDNFARLSANVAGLEHVEAVNEAVAGEPGTLPLFAPKRSHSVGQFSLFRNDAVHAEQPRMQVPVTTLEAVMDRHAVDRCDLLKIDTEGAEYALLTAAPPAVLERIGRIHAEYHVAPGQIGMEELATFLRSRGYEVELEPQADLPGYGLFFAHRPGSA